MRICRGPNAHNFDGSKLGVGGRGRRLGACYVYSVVAQWCLFRTLPFGGPSQRLPSTLIWVSHSMISLSVLQHQQRYIWLGGLSLLGIPDDPLLEVLSLCSVPDILSIRAVSQTIPRSLRRNRLPLLAAP